MVYSKMCDLKLSGTKGIAKLGLAFQKNKINALVPYKCLVVLELGTVFFSFSREPVVPLMNKINIKF